MAKVATKQAKAAKNVDPDAPKVTNNSILEKYLKENKEFHYNFEKENFYQVSTGSIKMDVVTEGGLSSGLHRFCGPYEVGKAQPISSKVLTKKGWVQIGDIKEGDFVIGKNGKETRVLGIYPQGVKDVFRVIMHDGAETRCCDEHLWDTQTQGERDCSRKNGFEVTSVKNTRNIRNTLRYGSKKCNHTIPYSEPIECFEEKSFVIQPYTMGVILGDGGISCSSITITSADTEIIDRVSSEMPPKIKMIDRDAKYTFCLARNSTSGNNVFTDELRRLDLMGKKSPEKSIPEEYLFSSKSQRLAILQGLCDTDGWVRKDKYKSTFYFYSSSEKMSEQVQFLIRSLGGRSRISKKKTHYKNKDGKRIICLDCYKVCGSFPDNGVNPFFISRKSNMFIPRTMELRRQIKDVVSDGKEECVCIKVEAMDSLYITDDFIVTHNTSQAITVMKNFLDENGTKTFGKLRKRRGLYIKAEGRLTPKMRARSGVKFVTEISEWEDGTCFIFETNVYETACGMMKEMVFKNPEAIEYFFILDSVDGLILQGDLDKGLDESNKVAGGAVVASTFMKHMSIPLSKRGHMAIFISQVRSDIKLDPYSSAPIRTLSATGGNALQHYANWIWEFGITFQKDLICKKEDEKPDSKTNPIVGHWVPVTIKKSDNEKSKMVYRYPVIYGRSNGRSVWVEKEIVDMLFTWELVTKAGSWMKFDPEFVELLQNNGIELSEYINKEGSLQFQGQSKVFDFVENCPKLSEYLTRYFKDLINGIQKNQEA